MKIKLITDSTADLSAEAAERYGITVVSLDVIYDGKAYKATKLPISEFYAKLKKCLEEGKPLPTTSQVTEVAFEEVLRPYRGDPDVHVVIATIAKEMSNTYFSAQKAIETLGMKNATLLDTKQTTFGLGALVCELGKLAQKDLSVEEFLAAADDLNKRVWIYVSIGDLRCLRAGGRLSAASMALGSMLKLKPVVYIEENVKICAKCIGQAKANHWIVEHVALERDESLPVYFGSSDAEPIIDEYRTHFGKTLQLTGNEEVFSMGPVVVTHAGLGCAGIAFFKKPESNE